MQGVRLLLAVGAASALSVSCDFINDSLFAYRARGAFDGIVTDSTYTDGVKEMPVTSHGTHYIRLDNEMLEKRVVDAYDVFDTISFVRLETTRESAIGYIDKVTVEDGNIFVTDRNTAEALLRFDMDGRFLNRIGRKGRGPGEYARITDAWVSDSTVLIYDDMQSRVSRYTFDGTFVEDIRTPFFAVQVAEMGDRYVFRGMNSHNYHLGDLVDHYLWTCDRRMRVLNKGYHVNHNDYVNTLLNNEIVRYEDKLFFSDVTSDTIYSIGAEALNKEYVLTFEGRPDKKEIFGRWGYNKERERLLRESKFPFVFDYAMTDDFLFYRLMWNPLALFIYNRASKQNMNVSFISTDGDDEHAVRLPDLRCSYKGAWVGSVEMCYFMERNNIAQWIENVSKDHFVRQIYDGGRREDNPVLVFMTPKR